jgi:hypothetical protein
VLLPDTPVEVEFKEQMGYGASQCHIVIRARRGSMKKKSKRKRPVFRPGGARQLLDCSEDNLTDDERALLLALASVDVETGRCLDEKERAALDKLKTQVEDYSAEELAQAVKHMVTAKAQEGRKLEWPELKRRRRKRRSSQE